MQTLIECVPNFSEGRDPAVVEAIVRALLAGPDVYLLDREMDADHNRSVITFVGTRESVGKAALRGIARSGGIDRPEPSSGSAPAPGSYGRCALCAPCRRHAGRLRPHRGMGGGGSLAAVENSRPISMKRRHASRSASIWRTSGAASLKACARRSARIPHRLPDFGEAALHPTAGATVVGARKFLIAYNINLNTPDVEAGQSHRQEDSSLEWRISLREGDGSGIESPQSGTGLDEPDRFRDHLPGQGL